MTISQVMKDLEVLQKQIGDVDVCIFADGTPVGIDCLGPTWIGLEHKAHAMFIPRRELSVKEGE